MSIVDKEFGEIKIRKNKLARSVKLSVSVNGSLRASIPYYSPEFAVRRLVNGNRDEIRKMLATHNAKNSYQDGDLIGKTHTLFLRHFDGENIKISFEGNQILFQIPENLPFESNKFDAVSVGFGVRNFENLEKGLSELRRVVKENGNVYILEFSKMEGVLSPLYNFYFNKVLPFLAKMISGEKEAYAYLPDSVQNFPCGERMKNILLDLGFSKVEYKKLSLGIVTIYKAKK